MRVSHALMLVVDVIAEQDETVMLQSQKVSRSRDEPPGSNCVWSLLKSCQSPGKWTNSSKFYEENIVKCCFPDHYSCVPGDADSCTDTWTGWECCKNDQILDDSTDSRKRGRKRSRKRSKKRTKKQSRKRIASLPGLFQGWNTSVGGVEERRGAADYFGVEVADDESLWLTNVMTPFIGRTLHMTDIEIIERNAFNTRIEGAVTTGTVLWTVNPCSALGVVGPYTEHINGEYTGTANIAGFVSATRWIMNDFKEFGGLDKVSSNDWGTVDVLLANETTVVMNYSSYKKAKFIMTWSLRTGSVEG